MEFSAKALEAAADAADNWPEGVEPIYWAFDPEGLDEPTDSYTEALDLVHSAGWKG